MGRATAKSIANLKSRIPDANMIPKLCDLPDNIQLDKIQKFETLKNITYGIKDYWKDLGQDDSYGSALLDILNSCYKIKDTDKIWNTIPYIRTDFYSDLNHEIVSKSFFEALKIKGLSWKPTTSMKDQRVVAVLNRIDNKKNLMNIYDAIKDTDRKHNSLSPATGNYDFTAARIEAATIALAEVESPDIEQIADRIIAEELPNFDKMLWSLIDARQSDEETFIKSLVI